MDTAKLWQLHREGRDWELMQWAQAVDPLSVSDEGLCELLGELFSGANQTDPAILWYRRANTDAARQALPLLLLRRGDTDSARNLLDSACERGIEWHEANYLLQWMENPSASQRLDALNILFQEQYLEPYMLEYAALCFQAGQEKKGLHMLKKQLRLFPGGPYEQQARDILDKGASAAQAFLDQLDARRRPQPRQAPNAPRIPVAPPAEAAPKIPKKSTRPLPEEVARCFDGVVGMSQARLVLFQLYDTVQMQQSRQNYRLDTRSHFHFLIRGVSGSGKTLLADRISGFLHELGTASDPAPCIMESYQLGGYLAGVGSDLVDALSQCGGRTVIVDGFSPLFDTTDSSSPSVKLFRTILEQFQEHVNFILIGTDEDVNRLLSLEPTMAGMFLYDIKLEPYSPEQLVEIARLITVEKGYTLSDGAAEFLKGRLERELRSASFQYGKTVASMIDRATLHLATRIAQTATLSKGKLMRIEAEDLDVQESGHSLEELLAELDSLTGLAEVKNRVRRLAAQAKVDQAAVRAGRKDVGFGTLHMIFTGNPGTGKTTVARIIGKIYCALGILPQGDKLVECGRSDLIGQYQGQTAPKVRAKVAEAMGGVLFIDEAYALCRSDFDTFGQEAVDTLVAEIENHRADLMVILAGYSEDMDLFLRRNSGLPSRFPNCLEFADYTQEEMEQIFLKMLSSEGKRLATGSEELLRQYIVENRGKKNFGNARGIRNLRDRLIEAQSFRLSEELEKSGFSPESYDMITSEDFDGLMDGSSRKKSLQDWLDELNSLTGLTLIKEQVRRKISVILAQKKMAERNLGAPMEFGTLHMVFLGNAGTGKTTAARIIGGIYNALGLLPSGDIFVECGRSDLVGGHLGETALKVKKVVDSALGGVLFIDEAYALCEDDRDFYGREAIDTLIAEMENHRKELMVILAGYSEDMNRFFAQNQGIFSRIPTILTFEDYTQEEMLQIFRGIVEGKGFTLPPDGEEMARQLIAERSRIKGFGNARGVRNLAEKVLEAHNARIGDILSVSGLLTDEELVTITPEDIQGI